MKTVLFSIFALIFSLSAEEIHEFRGKHLVADYLDCDMEAISDEIKLEQVMLKAVSVPDWCASNCHAPLLGAPL